MIRCRDKEWAITPFCSFTETYSLSYSLHVCEGMCVIVKDVSLEIGELTSMKKNILTVAVIISAVVCLIGLAKMRQHDSPEPEADNTTTETVSDSASADSNTVTIGVNPILAKQTFAHPSNDTNVLARMAATSVVSAEQTLAAYQHAMELNRTQAVGGKGQ